ncbi:MAG TPA: hypothetical protein VF230_06920 [Acidimicrobiales bacterium]
MTTDDSGNGVVRARRIEIVDDGGRVRAAVGVGVPRAEESVGVWLYDPDGNERVALVLHPTGPSLELVRGGNIAVHIGVADAVDDVAEPGPAVLIHDDHGVPVAGWAVRAARLVVYEPPS